MPQKLNLEFDTPRMAVALFLLDHALRKKGLFFLPLYFIQYPESKLVQILSSFLGAGYIERLQISKYKAEGGGERSLIETKDVATSDLLEDSSDTPAIFENSIRPFLSSYEIETANENDEYWEYEFQVNTPKLKQFLDHLVDLWRNDEYTHPAWKYEKQMGMVRQYIQEKSEDHTLENFEIVDVFEGRVCLPAVVIQLERQGRLELVSSPDLLRINKAGEMKFKVNVFSKNMTKNDSSENIEPPNIDYEDIQFDTRGEEKIFVINGQEVDVYSKPANRKAVCAIIALVQEAKRSGDGYGYQSREGFAKKVKEIMNDLDFVEREKDIEKWKRYASDALSDARSLLQRHKSNCYIPPKKTRIAVKKPV